MAGWLAGRSVGVRGSHHPLDYNLFVISFGLCFILLGSWDYYLRSKGIVALDSICGSTRKLKSLRLSFEVLFCLWFFFGSFLCSLQYGRREVRVISMIYFLFL